MTDQPPTNFGQWLKERREERGMTLRDVERMTNGRISNATISQIETGHIKNPGIRQILMLSAAYGLSDEDLLHRARSGNEPSPGPSFCPQCGQFMRPERVDF